MFGEDKKDRAPHLNHYELLRLIGEIDSIEMDPDCNVWLTLKGRKILILRDEEDFANRSELADKISKQLYS